MKNQIARLLFLSLWLIAACSKSKIETVQRTGKPVPVYREWIAPMLSARCYACHGELKSRADLRLDSPDFILRGSEHGAILVAGQAENSILYTNLKLPLDDDAHMPPDGEPQLSPEQIELIRWWIAEGASFDKTVKEMKNPPPVSMPYLGKQNAAPSKAMAEKKTSLETQILQQPVAAARAIDIKKLQAQNILITSFGEKTPYLMANFINVKNFQSAQLDDLQRIKNQLLRLKLTGLPVLDSDVEKIVKLKNLTRLNLEKTRLTDLGLSYLKNLLNLEYLNIYGTAITDKGLSHLAECQNLKVVYLWQTQTTEKGRADLAKLLRGGKIDTGGIDLHPK